MALNWPKIQKMMSDSGIFLTQRDITNILTGAKKLGASTLPFINKLVNKLPAPLAGLIKQHILHADTGADKPAAPATPPQSSSTGAPPPGKGPEDRDTKIERLKKEIKALGEKIKTLTETVKNSPARMSPEKMKALGLKTTPKKELELAQKELNAKTRELKPLEKAKKAEESEQWFKDYNNRSEVKARHAEQQKADEARNALRATREQLYNKYQGLKEDVSNLKSQLGEMAKNFKGNVQEMKNSNAYRELSEKYEAKKTEMNDTLNRYLSVKREINGK